MYTDLDALQMLEGTETSTLAVCCQTSPYTCGLTWPPYTPEQSA